MVRYLEEATGMSKDVLNQGDAWGEVTDLQLFECCLPFLYGSYTKEAGDSWVSGQPVYSYRGNILLWFVYSFG